MVITHDVPCKSDFRLRYRILFRLPVDIVNHVFCYRPSLIPFVFSLPVGAKHQSHQDYLEKADKARSERLSSGTPAAAK